MHEWYFAELDGWIAVMRDEVQRAILAAYGSLTPQEHAMDAANPSLLAQGRVAQMGRTVGQHDSTNYRSILAPHLRANRSTSRRRKCVPRSKKPGLP